MYLLHGPYLFAFAVSDILQNLTHLIFFMRKWFPGLGLKDASLAEISKPEAPWYPVSPIRDAASGAHTLFQYDQYFGSAAAVIRAVLLLYNAHGRSLSKPKAGLARRRDLRYRLPYWSCSRSCDVFIRRRDKYVMDMDRHAADAPGQEKITES